MNRFYKVLSLSLITAIAGCSAALQDYAESKPELYLERFFSGQLEAYGIVQDRSGKVVRRFKADIVGEWEGDTGVLDEVFYFADGEQQQRCWRLSKQNRAYFGTAEDVVGKASGQVVGNALNWHYTLRIPVDGKAWDIQLNDWMYLVDDNNLINRASMTKWGVQVGEITLFIKKLDPVAKRNPSPGCNV